MSENITSGTSSNEGGREKPSKEELFNLARRGAELHDKLHKLEEKMKGPLSKEELQNIAGEIERIKNEIREGQAVIEAAMAEDEPNLKTDVPQGVAGNEPGDEIDSYVDPQTRIESTGGLAPASLASERPETDEQNQGTQETSTEEVGGAKSDTSIATSETGERHKSPSGWFGGEFYTKGRGRVNPDGETRQPAQESKGGVAGDTKTVRETKPNAGESSETAAEGNSDKAIFVKVPGNPIPQKATVVRTEEGGRRFVAVEGVTGELEVDKDCEEIPQGGQDGGVGQTSVGEKSRESAPSSAEAATAHLKRREEQVDEEGEKKLGKEHWERVKNISASAGKVFLVVVSDFGELLDKIVKHPRRTAVIMASIAGAYMIIGPLYAAVAAAALATYAIKKKMERGGNKKEEVIGHVLFALITFAVFNHTSGEIAGTIDEFFNSFSEEATETNTTSVAEGTSDPSEVSSQEPPEGRSPSVAELRPPAEAPEQGGGDYRDDAFGFVPEAGNNYGNTTAETIAPPPEGSSTTSGEGAEGATAETEQAEAVVPPYEVSVSARPGDGAITMLMQFGEAAAAGAPEGYSFPEDSPMARLVAAEAEGNLYQVAQQIAIEQGLYRPNEAAESFNVWRDATLATEVGSDGKLSFTLKNPGGEEFSLWASESGAEVYTGSNMIDTTSPNESVQAPDEGYGVAESRIISGPGAVEVPTPTEAPAVAEVAEAPTTTNDTGTPVASEKTVETAKSLDESLLVNETVEQALANQGEAINLSERAWGILQAEKIPEVFAETAATDEMRTEAILQLAINNDLALDNEGASQLAYRISMMQGQMYGTVPVTENGEMRIIADFMSEGFRNRELAG